MTVNSSPYRSLDRTPKWLVRFTVVSITLATIYFAHSVYQVTVLEYDPLLEKIFGTIGNLQSMILVIVVIITVLWYYWTNKNIHSFGAKEVASPIMAAIWWFIPIANLWKPYYVTQQMWKASNPEINLIDCTEWRNVSGSDVITIWWILTLSIVFSAFILGFGFGLYADLQDNLVDSEST